MKDRLRYVQISRAQRQSARRRVDDVIALPSQLHLTFFVPPSPYTNASEAGELRRTTHAMNLGTSYGFREVM